MTTHVIFDHDEYARRFNEKDYWRQVKRTVNGDPVKEIDIKRIITKINKSLNLKTSDNLLDIGCGNGALTNLLKNKVSSIKGIDPSQYMIEIANKNFSSDSITFLVASALESIKIIEDNNDFNKILFYGSFSYLEMNEAKIILQELYEILEYGSKIFIGNIPNFEFHDEFFSKYTDPIIPPVKSHKSSIGIWYSPSELKEICSKLGWKASTTVMPKEFYASNYRFDLTLSK